MKKFMEENDIPKAIQERVFVYLELQWETDQGYNIMCALPLFSDLPPHMEQRLQIAMYGETLRSVPILQELNDDIIAELADGVEIYVLPPGSFLITYFYNQM